MRQRATKSAVDLPGAKRSFVLPYPPSANRYWRSDRGGQPHLSDEAKLYKRLAAELAHGIPLEGEVRFVAHVFRPRKSGDLGNRLKVLEDVLQGMAMVNDDQSVVIELHRWDDATNPRVQVDVSPAGDRGSPPPCLFESPGDERRFEEACRRMEAFAAAQASRSTAKRKARAARKGTPRSFAVRATPALFGRSR